MMFSVISGIIILFVSSAFASEAGELCAENAVESQCSNEAEDYFNEENTLGMPTHGICRTQLPLLECVLKYAKSNCQVGNHDILSSSGFKLEEFVLRQKGGPCNNLADYMETLDYGQTPSVDANPCLNEAVMTDCWSESQSYEGRRSCKDLVPLMKCGVKFAKSQCKIDARAVIDTAGSLGRPSTLRQRGGHCNEVADYIETLLR